MVLRDCRCRAACVHGLEQVVVVVPSVCAYPYELNVSELDLWSL